MAEALRQKWCEDLEELLECPVCINRLTGNIYLCSSGHNICAKCKPNLIRCPLCARPFTETRNFLAESLSLKLDAIKVSLIDPNPLPTTTTRNDSTADLCNRLLTPFGTFFCLVSKCKYKSKYSLLIPHLQAHHPECFEKCSSVEFPVSKSWEFDYRMSDSYMKTILIENVGLFVFRLDIDHLGTIRTYVFVYNSKSFGERWTYHIEISRDEKKWDHISYQIDHARLPIKQMQKNGLIIHHNDVASNVAGAQIKLKAILTIHEKTDFEDQRDEDDDIRRNNNNPKSNSNMNNKKGNSRLRDKMSNEVVLPSMFPMNPNFYQFPPNYPMINYNNNIPYQMNPPLSLQRSYSTQSLSSQRYSKQKPKNQKNKYN